MDENKAGFTAVALAAKNGHNTVIDVLRLANADSVCYASRRTGLNSLHVAACYGQWGKKKINQLIIKQYQ